MIRKAVILLYLAMVALLPAVSQSEMKWSLEEPATGFASNSVGDIVYMVSPVGDTIIWVGTGNGLSKSTDGGASWVTYNRQTGLNENDISALAVADTSLWLACAYTQLKDGEVVPYGKGFNRSSNSGVSWDSYIPWQVDFAGMLAYDIAIDDSTFWATCWYGGLIHCLVDHDSLLCENVFVDSLSRKDFEGGYFQYLNNRFFSAVVDTNCPIQKRLKNSINDIFYDGKLIWIATQNGLHASADYGRTYFPYDTTSGLNSNGVYCLGGDSTIMMAGLYQQGETTPLPLLPELTGADFSVTTDKGNSWSTSHPSQGQASAEGRSPLDIVRTDTVFWAACGRGGLIRSLDRGQSWENVFIDAAAQRRYEENDLEDRDIITSIAVDTFSLDTTIIWAGTADGLFKIFLTPGHAGTFKIIEIPERTTPAQADNRVIVSNLVYKRFGYEETGYPDSIIVDSPCYPYSGIIPGDTFEIPIILEGFGQYPIGGFEIELEYDYNQLTFLGVERGDLLSMQWAQPSESDSSDTVYWSWEYFNFRKLPCPACPCCRNKILLLGMQDLPNGPFHRGYCLSSGSYVTPTYWVVDSAKYYHEGQVEAMEVGATLAWLKFQVANNEGLRGEILPIVFEWEHQLSSEPPYHIVQDSDCVENTISSCNLADLYVSQDKLQFDSDTCESIFNGGGELYPILTFVDGEVGICPTEGELDHKTVLALGIQEWNQGKTIWASACSDKSIASSCSTYKSTDDGQTWTSYLGGILARDFAFWDSTVWIATYDGLKRSKDGGDHWDTFEIIDSTSGEVIIPSFFTSVCTGLDVDGYTVLVGSSDGLAITRDGGVTWVVTKFIPTFKKAIWAGTAAGIYKFLYNERSEFDTVLGYSKDSPGLTGDFVVSLALQQYNGRKVIWAGTQPTYSGGYGISYTKDDGDTWSTTLLGDKVWNFAFDDSVIWAATSAGLKRSDDWGMTWKVFDSINGLYTTDFSSVTIIGDKVWAGSADGLAWSEDKGNSWNIVRTAVPIGTKGSETAYAYPSPFSPIVEEGQVTRIRYRPVRDGQVTIKVYDFAMNLVKTLEDNQQRSGGSEYEAVWDGRNGKGEVVANGVYFFKVEAPGGQTEWGKVVVLK